MIGKVTVREWSNKVHPATAAQLMRYPMSELECYAKRLGITGKHCKYELIAMMIETGKATICGSLGN